MLRRMPIIDRWPATQYDSYITPWRLACGGSLLAVGDIPKLLLHGLPQLNFKRPRVDPMSDAN